MIFGNNGSNCDVLRLYSDPRSLPAVKSNGRSFPVAGIWRVFGGSGRIPRDEDESWGVTIVPEREQRFLKEIREVLER